jgi:O-antigen ligase
MTNHAPFAERTSSRWLPWALFPIAGLFLLELLRRPLMAVAVIGATFIAATASISVAIPLGLNGFAVPLVGYLGHDPFPSKAVPLISFAWIVLAIGFFFLRGGDPRLRRAVGSPLVLSTVGLLALLLVRLPASTDSSYGTFKVELFIIGNFTLLVAGIVLGLRPRDVDLYLVLTLAIDAISGLLVLRQFGTPGTASADRFGLAQQNVIALGVQGAEALMVATYLLMRGKRRWHQMFAAAVLPIALVALLASGSRGPVLGGVIGLLVLLAMLARSRRTAFHLLLLTLLLVASFWAALQFVPSSASERSLSTLTGTRSGLASNGRDQLWAAGWKTFTDHPILGVGTGSFATKAREKVCPGPGCQDKYPHNVLLETAAELGIVGALLTLGILIAAAWALLRAWRLPGIERDYATIATALFVAAAVTALLTGDISGDGTIWFTGGLGVGLWLAAQPITVSRVAQARTRLRAGAGRTRARSAS